MVNCRACRDGGRSPCAYDVPGQELWELGGERYTGCPFKIITRQSVHFIKAFQFYRQGFLPNPGGWINQPAKLLDVFEVIEKELDAMERERDTRRDAFLR